MHEPASSTTGDRRRSTAATASCSRSTSSTRPRPARCCGRLEAIEARARRAAAGAHQPEAAPALSLAERAGPPSAHPRRGRGRARARPALLGLAVLRQERAATRATSPGTRTAPTGACPRPTSSPPGSRSRRRRPRAAACASCPARITQPGAAQGHLRRDQPALARPGDRGRRSTRRGRRRDPRSRARCRCTTSSSSTARSRTAPTCRRVGFAIRYMPTHVSTRPRGIRESATLVRGTDAYGHFDHELPPEADLHPDAVARHEAIIESQLQDPLCGRGQAGQARPRLMAAPRNRDVSGRRQHAAHPRRTPRRPVMSTAALLVLAWSPRCAAPPAAARRTSIKIRFAHSLSTHRAGAPRGRVLRQERRRSAPTTGCRSRSSRASSSARARKSTR